MCLRNASPQCNAVGSKRYVTNITSRQPDANNNLNHLQKTNHAAANNEVPILARTWPLFKRNLPIAEIFDLGRVVAILVTPRLDLEAPPTHTVQDGTAVVEVANVADLQHRAVVDVVLPA